MYLSIFFQNEVRVGKKEYESQRAKMYGPYDKWHHIPCFVKKRDEMDYFDSGDAMAGFMTLSPEDQDLVKVSIKASKRKHGSKNGSDEPDSKKVKADPEAEKEKEAIKKQVKKIFYYRDLLERNLKKAGLQGLLEANGQEVPVGESKMLDRLSDCMTFGALEPCKECDNGQLVFRSGVGYQCMGNMSEWTKCQYKTDDPARKPFKVPSEYREKFDFLSIYKYKEGLKRIIPKNPSTVKSGSQSSDNGSSMDFPLKNAIFVIDDSVKGDVREKLKEKVKAFGGILDSRVSSKTLALIATKEAMDQKASKCIESAKKRSIQVVSPQVLDNVKVEGVLSNIKTYTISPWGSDPGERFSKSSGVKEKSGSNFLKKEMPKSVKMKLKGGGFVDPDSGLQEKAHVLKVKDALYSVVLGSVNIQEGKNSFYKLQILEHDKKPKWYVFRSWGRVGTTIGNTKLEDFCEKLDAVRQFEALYEEKTGNRWSKRHDFKKVPGKFYPLEIDYGQDSEGILL